MAPARTPKSSGAAAPRRRRPERAALYEDPHYLAVLATLAANTRGIRDSRGWTQEQAAERADLTFQVWQRVEGGKTNASLLTVARVAKALDVPVEALFRSG